MTRQEAVDAIGAHFATGWGTTTSIAWDNVPYSPDPTLAWVRVSIQHNVERQETVERGMYTRRGLVFVQIFVPVDTGRADVDVLVPQCQAIFEDSDPTRITFSNVTAREIGTASDEAWFQVNVTAEFEYTDIR